MIKISYSFIICAYLLQSCSSDSSSGNGLKYTGRVPRFSVDRLRSSGVVASSGLFPFRLRSGYSIVKAIGPTLIATAKAQEEDEVGEPIDCTDELRLWNDAPQLYSNADTVEPPALMYAFYAQANFYDCVARQQAQTDGVVETTVNTADSDTTNNYLRRVSAPDYIERFIAWLTNPNANDKRVKGKLVNSYQENIQRLTELRTRTRVDLVVDSSGSTKVDSILKIDDPNDLSDVPAGQNRLAWVKAGFKVILNAEEESVAHHIWGRYVDNSNGGNNALVAIMAILEKDKGASVRFKRCTLTNVVTEFNNDCVPDTTRYFNSSGSTITQSAATSLGLNVNFTGFAAATYTNFYSGTEEDFFRRTFTETSLDLVFGTLAWASAYATGDLLTSATRALGTAPTATPTVSTASIAYSSTTPTICTVDSTSGTITALNVADSCIIRATFSATGYTNKTIDAATIRVVLRTFGTLSWTGSYAAANLAQGASRNLGTAPTTTSPASGFSIAYSTTTPTICTVNATSGRITALSASGSCVPRATFSAPGYTDKSINATAITVP